MYKFVFVSFLSRSFFGIFEQNLYIERPRVGGFSSSENPCNRTCSKGSHFRGRTFGS